MQIIHFHIQLHTPKEAHNGRETPRTLSAQSVSSAQIRDSEPNPRCSKKHLTNKYTPKPIGNPLSDAPISHPAHTKTGYNNSIMIKCKKTLNTQLDRNYETTVALINPRVTSSDLINMEETKMQNSDESIGKNAMNPDHHKYISRQQKTKFKNVPNQKNKISNNSHKNHQRTKIQTGRTPGTENRTKTVPQYEKPYRTVRIQRSKKSMNGQEKHKESAI